MMQNDYVMYQKRNI